MSVAPAPPRCWSCRAEITDGRCPCSDVAEARARLWVGIRNALLIDLVLIGGFVLAFVVVGNWGRW